MKLLNATIPIDCDIALISDTHKGAKASYDKGINKVIRWVKAKENRYYCHLGDEQEARTIDHPYYDANTSELATPMQLVYDVAEQFEPIADSCLCWLYGNHPASLSRFGNLTEMLCERIRVPYGTTTCILTLNNPKGKQMFKMFLWHPFNLTISTDAKDYEQGQANMKARLKKAMQAKASDCLVMACGHTHKLIVVPPAEKLIMRSDGQHLQQAYLRQGDGTSEYIEPDRRWYCNTGSFLRTYLPDADTYSEKAGYDPVEMGYCVVKIRDGVLADIERVVV